MTAAWMLDEEDKGGWGGKYITFEELKPGDLAGFTFPPKPGKKKRVRGHIALAVDKVHYGTIVLVFHMSWSRGGIVESMEKGKDNYLYKYAVVYKRFGG